MPQLAISYFKTALFLFVFIIFLCSTRASYFINYLLSVYTVVKPIKLPYNRLQWATCAYNQAINVVSILFDNWINNWHR